MKHRSQTKVIYELELMTVEGEEIVEEFDVSYDSEFYDEDKESTDAIFINMRMADMKEKYGSDVLLLAYSIAREKQLLH